MVGRMSISSTSTPETEPARFLVDIDFNASGYCEEMARVTQDFLRSVHNCKKPRVDKHISSVISPRKTEVPVAENVSIAQMR